MNEQVNDQGVRRMLVVVPVYNNRDTIASVVRRCLAAHDHVLVVDDGSTDGTEAVLRGLAAAPTTGLTVIHLPANQGKGAALRRAFRHAADHGFTTIVACDADGQHHPEDLATFRAALVDASAQLIIGCRNFDADAGDVPRSSRFGRAFSNFWVWVETGRRLRDTQSGFRAYPVDQRVLAKLGTRRYDFEIQILVLLLWAGYQPTEVEIQVTYPRRDERVSHFRPVADNARLTWLHTRLCLLNLSRLLGLHRPVPQRATSTGERGGSWIMPVLLKLLGKRLSMLIMVFPLLYFFLTGRDARDGIKRFYEVLNDGIPDRRSVLRQAFANYWYFCCSLVDRLTADTIDLAMDAKDPLFEPGAIYAGAHYGDWLIPALKFAGVTKARVAIVMEKHRTPQFMRLLGGHTMHEVQMIDAMQDALGLSLSIKSALEDGFTVCFLADRSPGRQHGQPVPFLGRIAHFPLGPFRVASVLQRPVYFFCCRRVTAFRKSEYTLLRRRLWDGASPVSAVMLQQLFVKQLEDQVRQAPAHWFNFFDFWRDPHALV